jgi:glycolate dehydrogenase iron-sulfur subunit
MVTPTPASPSSESSPAFLDYEKSLACVHCGLCLSSCPTYLETGNENDSPRGRIYLMRAVQNGRLPLSRTVVSHLDLCLGCRACEAACPSGVRYGELLECTRDHIEHAYRRGVFQKLLRRGAVECVFPFPKRLRAALLPALVLKRLHLEFLLPNVFRDALALIPEPLDSTRVPQFSPAPLSAPRARLGFITGCVMSVLFGRTNRASIGLLNEAGFDVFAPADQGCCGALHAHGGNLEKARQCARHNIEVFENLRLDAVIINAAGCGSTLKEYGHLLEADPDFAERARRFSAQVHDLSEWLTRSGYQPKPPRADASPRTGRLDSPVTYHDACHLAHPQRITEPPRQLIRARAGSCFVELAESDVCCGSAGSYNLTEPEMAERLRDRKIRNILRSGARTVVTTNPGCLLQIQAGLRQAGAGHVRAVHLADFLEEEGSARTSETKREDRAST